MKYIYIAPNLFLADNPKFGNYNVSVIRDILCFVDLNMSKALGIKPFSSKRCLIDYSPYDYPITCERGSYHLILLRTGDNYWCQWVYQFAHEYCHHLINGPMVGGFEGLMWFEEMVCEVSSIYNLYSLSKEWSKLSPLTNKCRFAPSLRQYTAHCLSYSEKILTGQYPNNVGLEYYINNKTNSQLTYNRHLYTCLGFSSFLSQVIENPRLWRIILHIGDIRGYHSLDALFDHLFEYSDPSYSQNLAEFQRLFCKIMK